MNYLHVLTSSIDPKKIPAECLLNRTISGARYISALHTKCCLAQYLQILSRSQCQEVLYLSYDKKKKKKKANYHLLIFFFHLFKTDSFKLIKNGSYLKEMERFSVFTFRIMVAFVIVC